MPTRPRNERPTVRPVLLIGEEPASKARSVLQSCAALRVGDVAWVELPSGWAEVTIERVVYSEVQVRRRSQSE